MDGVAPPKLPGAAGRFSTKAHTVKKEPRDRRLPASDAVDLLQSPRYRSHLEKKKRIHVHQCKENGAVCAFATHV